MHHNLHNMGSIRLVIFDPELDPLAQPPFDKYVGQTNTFSLVWRDRAAGLAELYIHDETTPGGHLLASSLTEAAVAAIEALLVVKAPEWDAKLGIAATLTLDAGLLTFDNGYGNVVSFGDGAISADADNGLERGSDGGLYSAAGLPISTDDGNTLAVGVDGGLLVRANMRLVFAANFNPGAGVTVPVGLSNLPLNVDYIAPDYAGFLVDNLLQLPAGPHITTFSRISGSTELNTLLSFINQWQTTQEQGQAFSAGTTRTVISGESYLPDGTAQKHVAYPGCRVNNLSGSPITVSTGLSRIARQRMMQVQCYKVEV